jgi:heme/copper-type cytochrome/quinol oxidase subunit 2
MTTWLNLTLQDRASPVIEQLIFFHDHALIITLIIITTVFYTIIRIIQNKQTRRFILEGQIIETVWTTAPAISLVFIAIPSLWLLYLIDEIPNPVITLVTLIHYTDWANLVLLSLHLFNITFLSFTPIMALLHTYSEETSPYVYGIYFMCISISKLRICHNDIHVESVWIFCCDAPLHNVFSLTEMLVWTHIMEQVDWTDVQEEMQLKNCWNLTFLIPL